MTAYGDWLNFWRDWYDAADGVERRAILIAGHEARIDALRQIRRGGQLLQQRRYEWDTSAAYRTALACANAPEWAVWWGRELEGTDEVGLTTCLRPSVHLAKSAARAVREFVTDANARSRAIEEADQERATTSYTAAEIVEGLPIEEAPP